MNELFDRSIRMGALLDDLALRGDLERLLSACDRGAVPDRDTSTPDRDAGLIDDDRRTLDGDRLRAVREPQSLRGPHMAFFGSREGRKRHSPGTLASFQEVLRNPSRFALEDVAATTFFVSSAAFPAFPITEHAIEVGNSAFWKDRLLAAQPFLARASASVGCIVRSERGSVRPLGTAWLLLPGVIVTNRHVASLFCNIKDRQLSFVLGSPQSVFVDGRERISEPPIPMQQSAAVVDVLHIDKSYDLALLSIEAAASTAWARAVPIKLARRLPTPLKDHAVAVIGYPDYQRNVLSTLPNDLTEEEYQRIVGVLHESFLPNQGRKLVQPGLLTELSKRGTEAPLQILRHSCSTLGGNSGSVVLDLSSGEALGIHYASPDWLQDSEAVPSPVLCELLTRLRLDGHS